MRITTGALIVALGAACSVFPDQVEGEKKPNPDAGNNAGTNGNNGSNSGPDGSSTGGAGQNGGGDTSDAMPTNNTGGSNGGEGGTIADIDSGSNCEAEATLTLNATADATIEDVRLQVNFGSEPELIVATKAMVENRSLLRFAIAIPDNPAKVRIISADLRLTRASNQPSAFAIAVHRVQDNRTWLEDKVSWRSYAQGKAWTNQGSDFQTPAMTTANVPADNTGSTVELDVQPAVEDIIANNAADEGFLLRAPDTTNGFSVFSKEHTQSAQRPKLVIKYQVCH